MPLFLEGANMYIQIILLFHYDITIAWPKFQNQTRPGTYMEIYQCTMCCLFP